VNGCVSPAAIENVIVFPFPSPNLGADTSMCYDAPFNISPGSYDTYLWQDNSSNSFYFITEPGTYWVTVTDNNGCFANDTIDIPESCPIILNVPNAFSPNGDGINDYFNAIPLGSNITSYQMLIFDRWGEQVFSTNDFSIDWDGRYLGKDAEVATYIWTIYVEGIQANRTVRKTLSGTVTVLK
jgi:gliding motility-associated-like protein